MTAVAGRLKAPLRWLPVTRPGAVALSGVVVALFSVASYLFLDQPLLLLAMKLPPGLRESFGVVAALGEAGFWVPALAVVWAVIMGLAYISRSERLVAYGFITLFIGIALAVSGTVVNLLKMLLGRFGPYGFINDGSYGFEWFQVKMHMLSFPSGHANTVAVIATALCLVWPRTRTLFISVAVLAVLARAAQAAHFLSDVIAGAWLGVALTVWIHALFERAGVDLAAARKGRLSTLPERGRTV